jgi:hypothetical protein
MMQMTRTRDTTPRKGDITVAFKAIAIGNLPDRHKRVAAAVLDHYNRQTGRCDPSMESLSLVLQVSRRTVIRAMDRLERDHYFERDRHAGNFHCNQYYPVWERFREIDADWVRRRDMHRSRFDRTKLSHAPCQSSHLDGDTDVTQTYPNNHSYETFSGGHPSEGNGRTQKKSSEVALSTMGSISKCAQSPASLLHVKQTKPSNAARDVAERRWNTDLNGRYADQPKLYARIIDAIEPSLSQAATDAEIRFRGAGIEHILAELRRRDLVPLEPNGGRSC